MAYHRPAMARAHRNPYEAPVEAADGGVALGSEAAFRRLNRSSRARAAGDVFFGLVFVVLLTGLAVLLEGSLAVVIGTGLGGALLATGHVLRGSQTWLRMGRNGLKVAGRFLPWSDVFLLELEGQSRRRYLYIGINEGTSLRLLSVNVAKRGAGWIDDARALMRDRLTDDEQAFVERFRQDHGLVYGAGSGTYDHRHSYIPER
jgi:hypothetical protein